MVIGFAFAIAQPREAGHRDHDNPYPDPEFGLLLHINFSLPAEFVSSYHNACSGAAASLPSNSALIPAHSYGWPFCKSSSVFSCALLIGATNSDNSAPTSTTRFGLYDRRTRVSTPGSRRCNAYLPASPSLTGHSPTLLHSTHIR